MYGCMNVWMCESCPYRRHSLMYVSLSSYQFFSPSDFPTTNVPCHACYRPWPPPLPLFDHPSKIDTVTQIMQRLLHAHYCTSSWYRVHTSFLKALHLNGGEASCLFKTGSKIVQGVRRVSVHLMITIQKVTSNVQSVILKSSRPPWPGRHWTHTNAICYP
jgi:hypothetical protein